MSLFTALVGSQAYGTATPQSDRDYKGVHHAPPHELLGSHYRPQIDHSKDHVSYELRRFFELAAAANPTILELLYSPEDCVESLHPAFKIVLRNRHLFLTKRCQDSFGGYAFTQIKKARGLDKKMNWQAAKVEKRLPIDFCYIIIGGKTYKFSEWLKDSKLTESQIGLVGLNHAPHCYSVYISWSGAYRGVFKNSLFPLIETSSVPKGEKDEGTLVYNMDDYKRYKKDWDSYQTWLEEKNDARFVDNKNHGQKVDSKNLLHTRRLLDMALEIPTKGLIVRRPNADYLLSIRRGEVNLLDIIKQAEDDAARLPEIYDKSDLPDTTPDTDSLLLQLRYQFLKEKI